METVWVILVEAQLGILLNILPAAVAGAWDGPAQAGQDLLIMVDLVE